MKNSPTSSFSPTSFCGVIKMRYLFTLVILFCVMALAIAYGQTSPLRFKQERDGVSPAVLTPSELSVLGDPLFNLVLKDKANLVKIADIEATIQPIDTSRQLFVVEERIVSRAQSGSRRTVHAFKGTSGGEELEGNVMLSASF